MIINYVQCSISLLHLEPLRVVLGDIELWNQEVKEFSRESFLPMLWKRLNTESGPKKRKPPQNEFF